MFCLAAICSLRSCVRRSLLQKQGLDKAGVLRLMSGDGSIVHASIFEQTHTNANGTQTYTPYQHAGVAVGDIDSDDHIEIVTMVSHHEAGVTECWPAVYQAVQRGSNRRGRARTGCRPRSARAGPA